MAAKCHCLSCSPKDFHARKAINRTARLVTSPGFHFDSTKVPGCVFSDTPPATAAKPPAVPNLKGRKFGRFVVVGYCGRVRKKTSGGNGKTSFYWSVRCACGMYSIRGHRAILNPRNHVDACERCRHLRHLQETEVFRMQGGRK